MSDPKLSKVFKVICQKQFLLLALLISSLSVSAQEFLQTSAASQEWVDQTFRKLSRKEKIAQLMVIRLSERRGKDVVFFDKEVGKYVRKYNIGSICLFQGNSPQQAAMINKLQAEAETPLLVCVDGETGVGMRFGDITPFPDQLTLGAAPDAALAYKVGRAIGEQCKRIGIQVDYAPVVDINNNPNNPVINFRSLGEDQYKVSALGIQMMKGMQDEGVMACAKHFPGHGDVAVDSHYDLPVINKSMDQLNSLELDPFRQLIKAGVGSMMVAHLYIPAIDDTPNQATSLSKKNVTGILRDQLGFKGLTFTDALEMKGVSKFYPQGEAAVQSIIAGNDMLCLPGDIKGSIRKMRKAIRNDKLAWSDIDAKVRKVLLAKYNLGLSSLRPVDTTSIAVDLNSKVDALKKEVYENTITLLKQTDANIFPVDRSRKIAYLGIGVNGENHFSAQLKQQFNADCYYFDYSGDAAQAQKIQKNLQANYDVVVIGLHNYKKYPANNFGISAASIDLMRQLQQKPNTLNFVFGNPYAIKNLVGARNIVACYEDDALMHNAAIRLMEGSLFAVGKLPVTVSPEFPYGTGINTYNNLPTASPETVGMDSKKLNEIDSIALKAIKGGATPGAVVLVAKNGKVVFQRAYGDMNYDKKEPVTLETIYDLASVTKTSATTFSVMKLYEEGKLDLNKTLGDYLKWTKGTDKADLKLKDILLHQAGLVAFIPFYRETLDASGKPKTGLYSATKNEIYNVRVGEDLYMPQSRIDTMYKRILQSKLGPLDKYVYSDNDFIFLGKVVEEITGKSLNDYTREAFYLPLRMITTSFEPREHFPVNQIAPTEDEKYFRLQQIRGDVHDPGAAMFGGVAGHAGLFSNANDLAKLYVLLLNGGELNGVRLLKKETINYFTAYHSDISRRGLGFDKPEKDNATRESPYPTLSASPETFGHTGFTGIGVWADPKYDLLYIFLSNRVCPDGENNKLGSMNVRGDIQELIYQSIQAEKKESNAKL